MISTVLKFDPFSSEIRNNPYPTYARLRREDPIHWSFLQAWVISRYTHVETLLKSPQLTVDDLPERLKQKSRYLKQGNFYALAQTIKSWLFFLEPPHHMRLRGLVSKAFSPNMIETLRPQVQHSVNDLLVKVQSDQMDIIADFASPLPAMTITQILGVPVEDFEQLMRWSYDLFFVFDQPMSLEGYQKQNQTAIKASEYLSNVIAHPENLPSSSLIRHLIQAQEQEQSLTHQEILGFCIMLFIVGQETTKSLIGNGVLALLQHPEAMATLQQCPELVPSAVEELLRYDSPVQVIARRANADIEIGGKTIRAGDKVILCLGAANRDPDQFAQPDQLNFNRRTSSLPFGGGSHYCLGASLARIQGQIAIATLVNRFSAFKLQTTQLEWRESVSLRGLKTLPVSLRSQCR